MLTMSSKMLSGMFSRLSPESTSWTSVLTVRGAPAVLADGGAWRATMGEATTVLTAAIAAAARAYEREVASTAPPLRCSVTSTGTEHTLRNSKLFRKVNNGVAEVSVTRLTSNRPDL